MDPRKFWKNFGAQTGDKLILTKPLGAGIVNTAIKADLVTEGARRAVLDSMKRLNRDACEILKEFEVHACTDVTGFGLGGLILHHQTSSYLDLSRINSKEILLTNQMRFLKP